MALKPYSELVQVDVTPYCKTRDKAQYLPWAVCKRLLHEHGAEDVWFVPVKTGKGHTLHMTDETFTDKNGNTHRCYEVWVEVHIDDKEFTMGYPVINGIHAVNDGSLSQRSVHQSLCQMCCHPYWTWL